jgi:hypothetical protein
MPETSPQFVTNSDNKQHTSSSLGCDRSQISQFASIQIPNSDPKAINQAFQIVIVLPPGSGRKHYVVFHAVKTF